MIESSKIVVIAAVVIAAVVGGDSVSEAVVVIELAVDEDLAGKEVEDSGIPGSWVVIWP